MLQKTFDEQHYGPPTDEEEEEDGGPAYTKRKVCLYFSFQILTFVNAIANFLPIFLKGRESEDYLF